MSVAWALTVALLWFPAFLALGWRGVAILAASAALGAAAQTAGGWRGGLAAAVAVVLVALLA